MADTMPRHRFVIEIARRWRGQLLAKGVPDIPLLLDVTLALMIADMNGLRLDIDSLLAAPIDDIDHDVGGIYAHINRHTGTLDGLFQPKHILRSNP